MEMKSNVKKALYHYIDTVTFPTSDWKVFYDDVDNNMIGIIDEHDEVIFIKWGYSMEAGKIPAIDDYFNEFEQAIYSPETIETIINRKDPDVVNGIRRAVAWFTVVSGDRALLRVETDPERR